VGAFVGRIISDVGDRGTPGYWLERKEFSSQEALICSEYGSFLAL
jgi:hypothetical protein